MSGRDRTSKLINVRSLISRYLDRYIRVEKFPEKFTFIKDKIAKYINVRQTFIRFDKIMCMHYFVKLTKTVFK